MPVRYEHNLENKISVSHQVKRQYQLPSYMLTILVPVRYHATCFFEISTKKTQLPSSLQISTKIETGTAILPALASFLAGLYTANDPRLDPNTPCLQTSLPRGAVRISPSDDMPGKIDRRSKESPMLVDQGALPPRVAADGILSGRQVYRYVDPDEDAHLGHGDVYFDCTSEE
jgi:hypothetical protein